jgi:NADPH2:quinone reductase
MSNAIILHRTGGPEVLSYEAFDPGEPGPSEALIRQTAVGLNFIDTYHRSGLYPVGALPCGLGIEASGVVEAVGREVREFRPGDRVAYVSGAPGAYADRRCVSAHHLIPLPESVSDEVAAAGLLKAMTVEYLIRRCYPVQKGQTVLWHAVAGGVGLIACQWLRHLGVTVIGTVGSPEKAKLAAEHGCTHPVLYTVEDFRRRVRELTGGSGVPVVYDSVGHNTFEASLDCLAPRGLYVGFGNASGKPQPLEMSVLAQKGSLYVTRPTLSTYTGSRAELLGSARTVFDMLSSGAIQVVIGQRWSLAEAARAHEALEARRTTASSVLIP